MNEAEEGSCSRIFKSWDQRLTPTPSLKSDDDDPELLLHIPFTGSIKLKALTVIGAPNGASPSKLKVYINREDLDFSTAGDLTPLQEWDLVENVNGSMEYPVNVAKFNGVHSIDMYFPMNFGAGATEIRCIAFKGEYEERRRQAVEAVYEARALPQDHQVKEERGAGWNSGM